MNKLIILSAILGLSLFGFSGCEANEPYSNNNEKIKGIGEKIE